LLLLRAVIVWGISRPAFRVFVFVLTNNINFAVVAGGNCLGD